MSLIKIIANNIELDIVKETLTIIKENNSLISDFKVSYSNYPFLIVENSKTVQALGSRDITSINKPKIIPVVVEELGGKFYGELQILSYINGFRKVTLKYATELLTVMEQKISSFMPIISVIPNELNPVPFTEESDNLIPGSDWWFSWMPSIINEDYPAVKLNFPMMYWKNKFGIDLQPDDDWINYKQHVNYFDENGNYFPNYYNVNNNVITVDHKNVPSPQIYLLSPLYYTLQSLGWKMDGDFTISEFVKRILILSTKNNLCKTNIYPTPVNLFYPNIPAWFSQTIYSIFGNYITYKTYITYTLPTDGKYLLNWMFQITDITHDGFGQQKTIVSAHGPNDHYTLFLNAYSNVNLQSYNGSCEFTGSAGDSIVIVYQDLHKRMPINYSLSILKEDEKKTFFEFHPTIELGRYLPDWTFGTYLNELKKFFNLKVDIDDLRKTISLNFNESIIEISQKEIIKKSLAFSSYDQPLYDSFQLKFQNDEDVSLWITSNGSQIYSSQKSDFSQKLDSKFKFVPRNGYTAELSEDLNSKDGVGLMIYDSNYYPYIIPNYQNQTLSIEGQGGIYEVYWKKWLKFRLSASHVEMKGCFTETELSKIKKVERIYIDYQEYLVSSMEYSETEQSNFEVLLKLESINF